MPAIPSYMMGALNSAYDPNLINRLYDTAGGNLSAAQGSAANRARSSAASLAYGRGLLNPSGFTTNAGSQVYSAYAPQEAQELVSIRDAMERIEWALQEVLPQSLQDADQLQPAALAQPPAAGQPDQG